MKILFGISGWSFLIGTLCTSKCLEKYRDYSLLRSTPVLKVINVVQFPWILEEIVLHGQIGTGNNPPLIAPLSLQQCVMYRAEVTKTIEEETWVLKTNTSADGSLLTTWELETNRRTRTIYKEEQMTTLYLDDGTGIANVMIRDSSDVPCISTFRQQITISNLNGINTLLALIHQPLAEEDSNVLHYTFKEYSLPLNASLYVLGSSSKKDEQSNTVIIRATDFGKLSLSHQSPLVQSKSHWRWFLFWLFLSISSYSFGFGHILYGIYHKYKNFMQSLANFHVIPI